MASLGMILILLVMIIPLPVIILDVLLSLNITIALLILVICLYTIHSLEFAVFPTVLLVTTLFRLSLNVASTRLILLNGDQGINAAGTVISAFGQFVVGGNYVVGLVIFVILVVINFMVITKGAGRVAEVAARFTLDAMPGKQMAIDADLNAGLIDDDEARARRKEVAAEANFHGAMDGASKFVKGDAIAGIIITFINIAAGFVIGVVQKGMPMAEAAQTYTILTVGDGLVGQLPALVISTSAGILVTRTAGKEGGFGSEVKTQFITHPHALWVVSAVLLLFALIPGLPFLPFVILSVFMGFLAYQIGLSSRDTATEELLDEDVTAATEEENIEEAMVVDLLELEVGYGLIPMVDVAQDGELLPRIRSLRKQFSLESGFIVPPIHIKDNLEFNPNQYAILLKGVEIAGSEILPGHYLAMDPGTVTESLDGVDTVEPAFGLPAKWIPEDKKEQAQMAGYTVVGCTTVIATHISEIIKRHAHELLGRQEVQGLLDNLARSCPKLVEELVPDLLNLGTVMRVLQNLLREDVSIRDLRTIVETLADWAPHTQDVDLLTEQVRHALARQISSKYVRDNAVLPLLTLDRNVEETLLQSVKQKGNSSFLSIDPKTAESFLDRLSAEVENFTGGPNPVLLCNPSIRSHVKRLTERYLPNLAVISHNEIAPHLKIQSLGTVKLDAN
jgi:flagellar biosynthesis protein FlhA